MLQHRVLVGLGVTGLLVVVLFSELQAQRYWDFGVRQNDAPDTEFVFARWQYGGFRGGWEHDYPDAEEHINQVMKEATGINVDVSSYQIVPIASQDIFNYPFGYGHI